MSQTATFDQQLLIFDLAQTAPIDDNSDIPPCEKNGSECPSCQAMPVWQVSEPYVSLWLHDEPLGYQPLKGPRISFKLAFKQREYSSGLDPNIFGVGKKWNFSWFSYVARDLNTNNVVFFPEGGSRTYTTTNDYLTNTRLTGDTTNGFTLSHPDGSKDVYGFVVTNQYGFLKAFLTERWNAQLQKTLLNYANYNSSLTNPVVRLQYVIDGDGRTNTITYTSANTFSTNLISQVVDAFGRTNSLSYDGDGHLTNSIDVAGIQSSFVYDTNDWVTSITTPYGATSFTITDPFATNNLPPQGRSVLVTQPDGGKQLFLYQDNAPGVASSYATNQIPATLPYSNTLDTNGLNLRNTFYWGPRQCAALSTTTNLSSLTTNDFKLARMKHWLISSANPVGNTLSMERDPSPDAAGSIEGQKTWYDYDGKTNSAYEGTQVLPLFIARVLPDGTTRFTRSQRNSLGAMTNEVSTYSSP